MTADDDFRDFAVPRRRTAYLLTGDHHHAEDLLQTALAKVYLSWDRIRDPGAVEAYARRTLTTTPTTSMSVTADPVPGRVPTQQTTARSLPRNPSSAVLSGPGDWLRDTEPTRRTIALPRERSSA